MNSSTQKASLAWVLDHNHSIHDVKTTLSITWDNCPVLVAYKLLSYSRTTASSVDVELKEGKVQQKQQVYINIIIHQYQYIYWFH